MNIQETDKARILVVIYLLCMALTMDNIDNQKHAILNNLVNDQRDTGMDFCFQEQRLASYLLSILQFETRKTSKREADELDLIELIPSQLCDDDVVH